MGRRRSCVPCPQSCPWSSTMAALLGTCPQVFGEMFDVAEDMARYVPSFQYEVHDLGYIPLQELSRHPDVMAGLAVLKFVKHHSEMTTEHLVEILRLLSFDTDFAGASGFALKSVILVDILAITFDTAGIIIQTSLL